MIKVVRDSGGLKEPLAAAFALLVVTVLFFAGQADAIGNADEVEQESSRAIAIAYDNSGSMTKDSDKWCNAQYSLEVLAAMMGDRDELALFTMDSEGEKLHISGTQDAASRASAVHNADLGVSLYTEPRTAREACNWLFGQQADEKYLVITTDGEFNTGNRLEDVRQTVEDAASHGIGVIYLAIGEADLIASDESRAIYVKTASGDNILQTMTETANLIFGRTPLSRDFYDTGTGRVNLEVPMEKLIVFAQGADVHVGELATSDGSSVKPKTAQVRYRERPTDSGTAREWTDSAIVNTNLQGVVAVFDESLPKGEAKLDISGAQSYEIYYQPHVNIAMELEDGTGYRYTLEPGSSNKLTEGSYTVSYSFLDPDTGETLSSNLLYPADFSLSVDNGGSMQEAGDGDSIQLKRGTAVLRANATTPGGGKARQQYPDVRVIPPAVPLQITMVSRPDASGPIDVHHLDEAAAYKVHVAKEGGEELSESEWADTTLEAQVDQGWGFFGKPRRLEVSVTKSAEPGNFEMKLGSNGGNVVETLTGDVPVQLQALCDQEDVQYRGANSETVHISNPSIFDIVLYLLWLIVLVAVIVALLLWLFGAGRISARIWNNIKLEGWKIPLTCIGPKPRRIGGKAAGLVTNKWEWTGKVNAPIPTPAGNTIKLRGKYFRLGKEVSFVNYKAWRQQGWKLYDASGQAMKSGGSIRRGARMTHRAGYTIRFGQRGKRR
ncbi:MAG: VWA domain-containing protein [Eggerthellaceae bacterium]|nr:VWA domain-containing protein [Eggerthellaceae bacterium]